jgi:predicted nucleic acid-binding protein
MVEVIVDSYAWIEFFNGTERGKSVEKILGERICYTTITSLAEISEFCSKTGQDLDKFLERVMILSTILLINQKICILAGKLNFQRKKKIKNWGMMDSMLLAAALLNNLKILTGDKHFSDLPNVEML